jgi:hypothetical protein
LAAGLAGAAWGQPVELTPGMRDMPDPQQTRGQLWTFLSRLPPNAKTVLSLDPSLLTNEAFMSTYPALAAFAKAHPEIQKNPEFYIPPPETHERDQDPRGQALEFSRDILGGLAVFAGLSIAASILVWLIRTFLDHRRWSRVTKAQNEFHSKLLERFSANSELINYIQSPAGQKFLESSPLNLDAAAPRSMGAPLGRILWSLQIGVVLLAAGIGLQVATGQVVVEAAQPLHVLAMLCMALGGGFIVSAGASFVISSRLGLIESAKNANTERGGFAQ